MEHMDVESGEEALDITGEEISERHVVTEKCFVKCLWLTDC